MIKLWGTWASRSQVLPEKVFTWQLPYMAARFKSNVEPCFRTRSKGAHASLCPTLYHSATFNMGHVKWCLRFLFLYLFIFFCVCERD